jgi:hypothetical protein
LNALTLAARLASVVLTAGECSELRRERKQKEEKRARSDCASTTIFWKRFLQGRRD